MDRKVRYRELKKYGNTCAVIHLAPVDLKDYGWKFGDMIDISDCVAISKELYDVKFNRKKDNNKKIRVAKKNE